MAQMYWYTTARNSVNNLSLENDLKETIQIGNVEVCRRMMEQILDVHKTKKRPCIVAMDGYLGENWKPIVETLTMLLKHNHLKIKTISAIDLYKSESWMENLIKKYTDSDPSLGTVCSDKLAKDLLDVKNVKAAGRKMHALKNDASADLAAVICYGIGAAVPMLRKLYDLIYFYDMSRVSVTMKKFARTLREPHKHNPEDDFFWKKEMYFYYHILDKHRKDILDHIDGYIDANDETKLKLIPRPAYDSIITMLSQMPLKFKRYMQPGNWGGLYHSKYFNLPNLKNCAWDTTFYAPKNSCIVDIGLKDYLEIPFLNVQLKHSSEVVGPYLTKKYPGLLPMIACIDDGYFPKPVHHTRSNMPIHLHPDNEYAKKMFGETLGRYETYYIVEAYKNANTMLGFTRDADTDGFKQKILDAENKKVKFDWEKYVKTWPSQEGDLYLIPAGTVHGTGGHQMILEMDTCPSNVGTEYSFFIYDYLRPSWDDDKKDFCAPPVKLQIKHGFNQTRWYRREDWVKKNLLAKPQVTRKGKGWSEDKYASYGPMPFEIERLHFVNKAPADTMGRYCHLLFLTKGSRVLIRSKKKPDISTELEWIQFALIPAGFGEYECINIGDSEDCTVVRQRWKRG